MFQWEIASTLVSTHNIHKAEHVGRVQESRTGAVCFRDTTRYIKTVGKDEEDWVVEAGYCLGVRVATTHD